MLGKVSGRPPALDLEAEARLQRLLHEAAVADLLASAHDCSDGGLAVALAECAMAGGVGCTVSLPGGGLAPYVAMFSESASRAVVTANEGSESDLEQLATVLGVPLARLGLTGGTRLEFTGHLAMPLQDAVVVYEGAIPRLMAAAAPA
jgi:phosphoribosylformylglycinamidine synthase